MAESELTLGQERRSVKRIDSTLNKLGVRSDSDRFSVGNSNFTLLSLQNPALEETFYLGLIHHPYSGTHFSQIVSEVSPYRSNVTAMVGDFNEAKNSHRKLLEGASGGGLDRVHRGDPEVGRAYIEFFNNHLERWKNGLRNGQYNSVFDTLYRLRLTYNADNFIDQVAAQWLVDASKDSAHDFVDVTSGLSYAVVRTQPADFADYLRTDPTFLEGLRKPLDSNEAVIDRFHRLGNNWQRRHGLLYGYIKQLPEDQLKNLVLADLHQSEAILIDIKQQSVLATSEQAAQIDFVDREKFWVRDPNTGGILVRTRMNSYGQFEWKVLDYDLAEVDGHYSLPLWAWSKNQQGERRFLPQQEALVALTKAGLGRYHYQADVMLGRVSAASFVPQVTYNWRDRISLITDEGKRTVRQNISGAQVGAWVSMADHASELLNFYYFKNLENITAA